MGSVSAPAGKKGEHMKDVLDLFSKYLIKTFEKDKELKHTELEYDKDVIKEALLSYRAKYHEITQCVVNVTREDVLGRYIQAIKKEEHMAFLVISLILFGIFVGAPLLGLYGMFMLTRQETGLLLELLIIESVAIVGLSILTGTNVYWGGVAYRKLRKNGTLSDMYHYMKIDKLEDPVLHAAFILQEKEFRYAYINEDEELCIAYMDDGIGRYYTTYDFQNLCGTNTHVALQIDSDALRLVPAK